MALRAYESGGAVARMAGIALGILSLAVGLAIAAEPGGGAPAAPPAAAGAAGAVEATADQQKAIADLEQHLLAGTGQISARDVGRLVNHWRQGPGLDAGRQHYEAMLSGPGDAHQRVMALLVLAEIDVRADQPADAKACVRQAAEALTGVSDEWAALTQDDLMSTCLSRQWTDEALAVYNAAPIPGQLMNLAGQLEREGRGDDTLALYGSYLFSPHALTDEEKLGLFPSLGPTREVLDSIVGHQATEQFVTRYQEAIAKEPDNPRWRRDLGYIYLKHKDYDAAEEQFRQLIRAVGPPTVSLYAQLASLCRQEGRTESAITYLEQARDLPVTDAEADVRARGSQVVIPLAESKNGLRLAALGDLADLYQQAGRLDDAEKCYLQVVELSGKDKSEGTVAAAARKALAEIWKSQGKPNQFIEELRRQVAVTSQNAQLREDLADALLDAGQADEAASQYGEAIKLSPEDPTLQGGLARALAAAGKTDEAIAAYRRVLEVAPASDRLSRRQPGPFNRAQYVKEFEDFCQRTGRTDDLLQFYRGEVDRLEAAAAAPADGQRGPNELAVRALLDNMTKVMKSKGQYDQIAALWLEHRATLFYFTETNILQCLRDLSDPEAFIASVGKLADQHADDAYARVLHADLLWATGREDQAKAEYEAASKQLPEGSAFRLTLAHVLDARRLYEPAADDCETYLRSLQSGGRDYTNALGETARAERAAHRYQRAADLYREYLGLVPGDSSAQDGLAECLRALGGPAPEPAANGPAAAGPRAAAPRAEGPGADDEVSRADDLAEVAIFDKAIPIYEHVLETRTTDVGVMVKLADALLKSGQDERALQYLEKAYALRNWSGTDYGIEHKLEAYYGSHGLDAKLVELCKQQGHYDDLRDYMTTHGKTDEFIADMESVVAVPNPPREALYALGRAYADAGKPQEARALYEKCYRQIMSAPAGSDSRTTLWVADGFEGLGDYGKAIAVLERSNAKLSDNNRMEMLSRLARLYALNGQIDPCLKAVEDLFNYQMTDQEVDAFVKTFGDIAAQKPEWAAPIDALLKRFEANGRRQLKRFAIALRMRLPAPPGAATTSPVLAVVRGVVIQPPADAPNLSAFLERVAEESGTLTEQGFMRQAQRMPAPKMGPEPRSACEALAEAISGTQASLEITQAGYWALSEGPAPCYYAAGGGVIFALDLNPRFADADALHLGGRLIYPTANVVAHATGHDASLRWQLRGMNPTFINFTREQPEGGPSRWTGHAKLAVATSWVELKAPKLDVAAVQRLEAGGVVLEVGPLRTQSPIGEGLWELPIKPVALPDFGPGLEHTMLELLGEETAFGCANGGSLTVVGGSTGGDPPMATLVLQPKGGVAPETTTVRVRVPTKVETVDVPLQLYNVPDAAAER